MLNLEVIERIYNKYTSDKEKFKKYKKLVEEYENNIDNPLAKDYSKNKELMEEYLDEMNRLLNSYFYRFSQFVLIRENNREYLIDLKELKKYDISSINLELKNFIIMMIQKQDSFIGVVSSFDLPLLMNIKEELENIDLSNLSFEEKEDKLYLFNLKLTSLIRSEYNKTKLLDSKNNKKVNLPFIFDSDSQIRIWEDFDICKGLLKEEEYLIEYYKILMLFGNNIEEIYIDAKDNEKDYVIDAYMYVSTKLKENERITTSSSIINEKVLERRFLNK